MKIVYHHRTQAMDGQAVHVREMIAAWRKLGCQVEETAMVRHSQVDGKPAESGRGGLSLLKLVPRFGREILEHAYSRIGEKKVLAAVHELEPHFIYERYALANMAGVRACTKIPQPLFLEVNSPMVFEMEKLGKLVFRRWARRVEIEIFSRADLIFTVSRVLKNMLINQGISGDKIIVQHNAADPSRFPDPAEKNQIKAELDLQDRFVIGFSGYLRSWHRTELVLESMAALADKGYKNLHFLLLGEGPGVAFLRRRAEELCLTDRLTITGGVPPGDVPRLVSAFDTAVVPAINHYASPLKLFDYLGASLPVLAPAQENLREVLTHGKNALLFNPGDQVDLQAKLASVLADPQMAMELGQAGRKLIEGDGYNWESNARRVIKAYENRFTT